MDPLAIGAPPIVFLAGGSVLLALIVGPRFWRRPRRRGGPRRRLRR